MKILYLTTSMIQSDFDLFNQTADIKLNPSNQNFHRKLIKSLSLKNELFVISLVPSSFELTKLQVENKDENQTKYFYIARKENKYLNAVFTAKTIYSYAKRLLKKEKYDVILFDGLNVSLGNVADKLRKKYEFQLGAIVTDNPANITGVSKKYVEKISNNFYLCDFYLTLTEILAKVLSLGEKKTYVFEGIVEEGKVTSSPLPFPYAFFGGALYEKYGVKTLIEAYIESEVKYPLVIAGHGELDKEIKEINNEKIKYVGLLNQDEILSYCSNAKFCINPRPYMAKIDYCSIPSKVIEYCICKVPVLSTLSTPLKEKYKNLIYWIDKDSKEDIKGAIKKFLNESEENISKKVTNCYNFTKENYSIEAQSTRITSFLNSLLEKENSEKK